MRPRLLADGGEMTVGRKTATYVYGAFHVDIPEDRSQDTSDDRLQDGYIYRPDRRPAGRFNVAFVRADVRIDLNAQQSNLELIVDAAQDRTEGKVFFEKDISGGGLSRFIPGVDYTTASLVDVLIWGKIMRLPVTAIDMVSGSDGVAAWRVHVGGQMIADAAALRSHNDAIKGQIEQERRRRLAATKTATEAHATASSADRKAGEAREVADETARALARENHQRIKENEAFASAMSIYFEAIRPRTGAVSRKGTLTWRSAKVDVNKSDMVFTALNMDDVGFRGVAAIVIVRVYALSQYSTSGQVVVSKQRPTDSFSVDSAEEIARVSVTIHPQFDFSEILLNERRKRGLA